MRNIKVFIVNLVLVVVVSNLMISEITVIKTYTIWDFFLVLQTSLNFLSLHHEKKGSLDQYVAINAIY